MLRQRFEALWARVAGADASARDVWARLDTGYGDHTRAYHGWDHVSAMLDGLDEAKRDDAHAGLRFHEIELAVFFHDAIYDPERHDNETASAALFIEASASSLAEHAGRVESMILATAEHRPSADLATRLLLDLDLAILGAPADTYQAYTEAIRREYAHVPEIAWQIGRYAVLRRFLDRERIFQTERFALTHEQPAQLNLRRELTALEA